MRRNGSGERAAKAHERGKDRILQCIGHDQHSPFEFATPVMTSDFLHWSDCFAV
jgi:hypothetical protein